MPKWSVGLQPCSSSIPLSTFKPVTCFRNTQQICPLPVYSYFKYNLNAFMQACRDLRLQPLFNSLASTLPTPIKHSSHAAIISTPSFQTGHNLTFRLPSHMPFFDLEHCLAFQQLTLPSSSYLAS